VAEAPNPGLLTYRIAGFGLPTEGDSEEGVEIPPEIWPPVLAALRVEKITGLAVAGAERGWLRLSEDQAAELLEAHRSAMARALAIERTLLKVATALEAERIEFLVLKGSALAHTIYPDPSWRSFIDLDLLVRTEDWRRTLSLLADMRFRRRLPEPRARFDERFGKAAAHVGEEGVDVDLHRTLVLGPFGLWMAAEELFRRTASFPLGGRRLPRLDDTALLVHACMHAALGFVVPLILPMRDVAQVSRTADVDWEAFEDLVQRWRLQAVVQHAFTSVATKLRVPWPAEVETIMEGRPPRAEHRALLAYMGEKRGRGAMTLSTLRAIPGIRAKAAFAASLVFPRRAFLSARAGERGTATYRRRWAVPVRWLRTARPGGKG
jgi:hypothetical protein